MKNKFGLLGFISLLGFIGLFTDERGFLFFFAYIVDFRYFFVTPDEMFMQTMRRASSNAFFVSIAISVISTITICFTRGIESAFNTGCAFGFVGAFVTFTLLLFYYEWIESKV